MSEYQKTRLKKFAVSLYWNVGVYVVLFMLDTISKNLGGYNLTPTELALVSILCARITKVINVELQAHRELE